MKEIIKEMELNIDELEQVNGGEIICIFLGSTDRDSEAVACISEGYGAAACISALGFGIGGKW